MRKGELITVLAFFVFTACEMPGGTMNPEAIDLTEPAAAVEDARRLISEHLKDTEPTGKHYDIRLEEVPATLKFQSLRFVSIGSDHVDLITHHDPDVNVGFRIWSADAKRERTDKPTKYRDVFHYSYNDDRPATPDNLP